MSAPSWFDWKNATISPSSAARAAIPRVDLLERLVPVDLRLACAEQVEVRSLRAPGRVVIADSRPRAASRRPPRRAAPVHVVADHDAVGRRQDPAQAVAPCFLSVARWSRIALERVGERVAGELERVEERRRSASARSAGVTSDRDPDPDRGAQAVGHGLAVEQLAVPGGRLDRVARASGRG